MSFALTADQVLAKVGAALAFVRTADFAGLVVDLAAAAWAVIWTVDFAGLVFGVAGTLLLATKGRLAGWGFVAFLGSNLGWILFAYEHAHVKLLAQHLIFSVSSLFGVWMWLLWPRVKRALQEAR
jgi:hypothetical protein